jgi:hypothetical protein
LKNGGEAEIRLKLDTYIDGSSSLGQFSRQEKLTASRDHVDKKTVLVIEATANFVTTTSAPRGRSPVSR